MSNFDYQRLMKGVKLYKNFAAMTKDPLIIGIMKDIDIFFVLHNVGKKSTEFYFNTLCPGCAKEIKRLIEEMNNVDTTNLEE